MSAETVGLTGKILGAMLFYPPASQEVQPLIALFKNSEWKGLWPCASEEAKLLADKAFQREDSEGESIDDAFQRLFVGPYALPAPPCGSVYRDKESVVFGDSTLALRQWMREHNIEAHLAQAEPEDHIGLMLMMSAWIAENEPSILNEFLALHLMPWSARFLSLLGQKAGHPFYQGVAILAKSTIQAWEQELALEHTDVELYF